jgi:hypothetical protein
MPYCLNYAALNGGEISRSCEISRNQVKMDCHVAGAPKCMLKAGERDVPWPRVKTKQCCYLDSIHLRFHVQVRPM